MPSTFRLRRDIDLVALRRRFATNGRVRIADFLATEDAVRLHEDLLERRDWLQVVNSEDKVFELDRATREAMTDGQRLALDKAVIAGARSGFQYRYESVRVPDGLDARAKSDDLLTDWAQWMSQDASLALTRAITGADDIVFADAQATAYAPGDLLTAHDDEVKGKARRAAYVFGLTPQWRVEWGGLLMFHDGQDRIEGLCPSFNTLDLFTVPHPHSVSTVTPAACDRRYSITGWLRAQRQPD